MPSKNNYKEFRKGLSGKIEYQGPNTNVNEFIGYFRLKKDPKIETLTNENFIPRGATLKYADWVFGLIVYTGADTKIMMNSNYKRHKISYLEYLTQLYFIFSFFITFFLAIINTIATIARVKAYNLRDKAIYKSLIIADPNIDDTSRIVIYILLYSPLMPLFLYGFLDCINYLQKVLIEYKFSRDYKDEICKIIDPMPFINIAQAKYALIDKTGTLTTSNYKINQIFFNNKVYKIRVDPKEITESISEQEKIKYFSSPFKNTTTKGETLFANNLLLTSVNNKEPSIIASSDFNIKQMKKFLSKIEESNLDLEDVSVHSDQEQINEIKENNVFTFKRDIELVENDEKMHYDDGDEYDKQKRSTTEIVRRLLGQENSSPSSQGISKKTVEIQLPQIYQTQEINSTNRIMVNNKQVYESLNNSMNNDNSQISFRNPTKEESFPLKQGSPQTSNRLAPDVNPYEHLYHNERDFLQDLLKLNSDQNLDSLFEALTLCHGARTQLSSNRIICGRREDEVILEFCKKLYFVFDKTDNPENPSQYYFKYKTQKLVYNIFGINDFSTNKKSFSVVYKSPINEELWLLCKGEEDYMRGLISMTKKELEIYDFLIKDMQNQGLKPIVYARKLLNPNETQSYYNKMKNLKTSLITQNEEVILLGKSLEFNLELLLIIGLKDELNEGVEEMIDFMNELGVNVWMVTGDCKENAISSAYATRICNPLHQKPKEITIEDEKNLNVVIRNYLIDVKNNYNAIKTQIQSESEKKDTLYENDRFEQKLSKQMSTYLFRLRSERSGPSLLTQNQRIFNELRKKMQSVYLIINGKSLEIIMEDVFLKAHFIFILSLVKNVIAYGLSPEMKEALVTIIQSQFVGNPSVMAIGDNYNDVMMMQKADIGIELIKKEAIEKRVNAGDVQISNLKLLKPLILNEGVLRLAVVENLIFFMFYQSFLIGITIFLFYWYCAIDFSRVSYTLIIFFYFLLFSTPNVLIYGVFDRPINTKVLKIFPGLYCEGPLKKRFIFRRFILKSLMDALFHSMLIFYILLYGLRSSMIPEGQAADLNTIAVAVIVSLILVNNLKMVIKCVSHRVWTILFAEILSLLFLVFFLFIVSEVDHSWNNWQAEDYFLFSNLMGLMLIAGVVVICLLWSFLAEQFIYKAFVPNVYNTFANQNKVGEYGEFTNETIINHFEISRLVHY